ncbi:BTAD domain-containing putative transcriptional regulator [Streptomyces sp. SP17BM10]|uniref:AfsR/SARP family transcriptional regulator n=1 Tax=Streptomyces sp. SP17BM10 TaxID=3002530 RepID=UPI002E7961DD|nr:BTAD domain-containing putative transcriptional regulator [Streptomyces sp. SP17BM10]MEE1788496.1 BTAD domain-containing putative transcriptional regulator [Streptomyces sp. SP17BM10]
MGIRLLGPVELALGTGAPTAPGGAQRRAVLALLALELNRTVAVERLAGLLWDDEPPAHPRAALQGHVAALRKLLAGSPFELTTRSPGYRLTGDPADVDALAAGALGARAAATEDDATAAALLERALRLWQGAALADLPATAPAEALALRLDEARTGLLTAWAQRQLRLGRGFAAVPALEQAVAADGLREPVAALLVRCLHRSGRTAAALEAYHRARARLAGELGVAPGPELQQALADVLADDQPGGKPNEKPAPAPWATPPLSSAPTPSPTPEPPTAPDQLPTPPRGFVGREAEERWLDAQCGPDRTGDGLAVVVGPAGVGKTATAVRWAHRAAPGFPDGRLFADLRGFDPAGPADPAHALGRFLRALGVPEPAIPEDRPARAALFRERTRGRRLLVVLDNARSADDVTDLLPAGPDCVAVVTSRNSLEELVVADGAAMLQVGVLPAADAHRLLQLRLTAERVAAEPEAARHLVELCDRLPLALRIAAARLAARPGWQLADLVAELTDERTRLSTLATADGTLGVHSALSLTYRHLPSHARDLLPLLTPHPGTEVDVHAASALLAADTDATRLALGSLAAHHLLTETTPGRFARHDLVRLYGAELFAGLPADRRQDAFRRLADYELLATGTAVRRLNPYHEPFRPPGTEHLALPRLTDPRAALAWCHAEEPVLRALVTAAAERGEHERAWRLARATATLYYGAGRVHDRLACLRVGLDAARASGDREGLAAMEATTACALGSTGRVAEALPLAGRAVERTTPEDGDLHIHALSVRASMTALTGDQAGADRLSDAALALVRRTGLREHAATVLSNAAALKVVLGAPAAALDLARETRDLLAAQPTANAYLWAMVNEAFALHALDDPYAAELTWREALHLCRSSGNVRLHALAHRHFGEFLDSRGRCAEAAEHRRTAGELYTAHGDVHLAAGIDRLLSRTPEAPRPLEAT